MKKSEVLDGEYNGIVFYELFPDSYSIRIVRYAPTHKLMCILYHDERKQIAFGVTNQEWQSYCEKQTDGYLTHILGKHTPRFIKIRA